MLSLHKDQNCTIAREQIREEKKMKIEIHEIEKVHEDQKCN